MVEGSVDETLDEGRVVRGRGNTNLVDSRRGDADGYLVLLWAVFDDDVGLSRGIIRERFLFLWGNMNDSSIVGGTMGGLSSVSASFRHGGMYVVSHT